jgi:hypothetical protein
MDRKLIILDEFRGRLEKKFGVLPEALVDEMFSNLIKKDKVTNQVLILFLYL